MVEAAIVISMLTLGLMGLMFFRSFYIKQMLSSRLARSSILAYSMTGCDGQQPKDWIGSKDLASLTATNPSSDSQPATGKDQSASASSSDSNTNGFLSGLGLSGDGRGVLNPISTSDLNGKVTLQTNQGILASPKTMFSSTTHARSFVSCGDKIRSGDIGDLVKSLFGSLGKLVKW